jgi:hypothetical protein
LTSALFLLLNSLYIPNLYIRGSGIGVVLKNNISQLCPAFMRTMDFCF